MPHYTNSVRLVLWLSCWSVCTLSWTGSALAHPNAPLYAVSQETPSLDTLAIRSTHMSMCMPPPTHVGPDLSWGERLEAAKKAISLAEAYRSSGQLALARLQLTVAAWALPELEDRFALDRAELLMQAGLANEACQAFALARKSPDSSIVAKGRVGEVRCLLAAKDKRSAMALDDLLKHYPGLPEALDLKFALGEAKESWKDTSGAINVYRTLDLNHPGSLAAEHARQRLKALQPLGTPVHDYTLVQRMARAARLIDTGPFELARAEISHLLDAPLSRRNYLDVIQLASQLARRDGGTNQSLELLLRAQTLATSSGTPLPAPRETKTASKDTQAQALSKIERITKGRTYSRLTTAQLKAVMTIAVSANLAEPAQHVLVSLSEGRRRILPGFRYELALLGAGIVTDPALIQALEPLVSDPRYGLSARYHYARALERSGQLKEAETAFRNIIRTDTTSLPYYRMWATQRLNTIQRAQPPSPQTSHAPVSRHKWLASNAPYVESKAAPMQQSVTAGLKPLAADLHTLAMDYKEAYPWLYRAWILIALGQPSAASDELHEAYLAWRAATGRKPQRAGLAAVYKGRAIRPTPPSSKIRQARRELDVTERELLAKVCASLGDYGTAIGLAGWQSLNGLPRPYHESVRAIAKEYNLDPNLLLAVMRVESVYQKRIISYAGALGLMQIMPRTGTLIARKMGADYFTTADLLDPDTNIKFAAWYLASLLKRFDGALPLAIAAYNGGPHNVRKWLTLYSDTMPLDVFLEHIPFSQTHRYVRRVLTHYAEYRAQEGLSMVPLDTHLPKMKPSAVAF